MLTYAQMERDMADSTTNASKEVKRLKEELDGMIKKKLEVEKELAKEKAKKADELKEKLDIATEEIKKVCAYAEMKQLKETMPRLTYAVTHADIG
jgi:hypothetical protein